MINANMQPYVFFTFGEKDAYGQPKLSNIPGLVKMSIAHISTTIGETIKYKDATYIGLTKDAKVNDTYVIRYKGRDLKVLYVIPGRFNQVFMVET